MNIKNLISRVTAGLGMSYKRHKLKGAINYLLSLVDSALRLPFALARPTSLQITAIEGSCNLSCEICPPFTSKGKKELSFDSFKRIFDASGYISSLSIAAHGEPFMAKDIFRIIDYAKSKNCEVSTVTNMTLVNKDMAKKLVISQFDYLYISFDAAAAQLFEKIRKGSIFETVINNIKTLNLIKKECYSEKPALFFTVTAIKENLHEIPGIVELAAQLDIRGIGISPLIVLNKGLAIEEQSPTKFSELAQRVFSTAKARAKELGVDFLYPDYRRHFQGGVGACRQPWKILNVITNGTVQPCCNHFPALGNIFNDPLWCVWNNKKFRLIRKAVRKENSICYHCLKTLNKLRLDNTYNDYSPADV